MKNPLLTLCFVATFASYLSITANAENLEDSRYYVGAQYNIPARVYTDMYGSNSATKQSFPNIDLAIGAQINDHFRVEFSPGYRSYKYKGHFNDGFNDVNYNIGRVDLYKLMFNGYVDGPKFADTFTPYVMAGVGYAHINKSKLRYSHEIIGLAPPQDSATKISGNNFAWQTGVGINTALTKAISMDIGVVYAGFGKLKFASDIEINGGRASDSTKLRDIEAFIGFRYSF